MVFPETPVELSYLAYYFGWLTGQSPREGWESNTGEVANSNFQQIADAMTALVVAALDSLGVGAALPGLLAAGSIFFDHRTLALSNKVLYQLRIGLIKVFQRTVEALQLGVYCANILLYT